MQISRSDHFLLQVQSVDFAFMATGTQSAEITLQGKNKEYSFDLGNLIQSKKDLYVRVDNTDIEMQYASGVDVSLATLCDASPAFNFLCDIFGDSGIFGRVNAYFNTRGDFGLMLDVSGKFELDLSGGGEVVEEIVEDVFGGEDISFEGSAELSVDFDDGNLELCLNLNNGKFDECLSFCSSDSDCADDKFCNPLIGMCRPKRDNGFWPCIEDTQCNSGRCVDTTRLCADFTDNGGACLVDKECKSGDCSGALHCNECPTAGSENGCGSGKYCKWSGLYNHCVAKKATGESCSKDLVCKSGDCSDMSFCNEDCTIGSTSGDKYCAWSGTNKKWVYKSGTGGTCSKDYMCRSGDCSKLGFCNECPNAGSTSGCGSGKYCKWSGTNNKCVSKKSRGGTCTSGTVCSSGKCSWGFCT